jgi:6-phosphofructo-2-kinase
MLIPITPQKLYPIEYKKRQADKVNYRYPGIGGESYRDVIERLHPIILGEP